MKSGLLVIGVALLLFSCKEEKKEEMPVIHDTVEISEFKKKTYPNDIAAVFEAHGGLEQWSQMNNLCFEIDKPSGKEIHTTSLPDRRSKIETENWSIGHDGNAVWLLQNNEEESYKGNARFYHNLMFYFYAMPFIVADDGIIYESVPATELMGERYPGVKISYKPGIGDSSNDEYIVFYEPNTNKMKWLGYTVTYGEDGKSDDWHFIKYDKWQEVNGLVLPKTLEWYTVENGKPVKKRNTMKFEKVTATQTILEASSFAKPLGAVIVE